MQSADFIVIGAGIAGASAAGELAAHGRVLLLEAENQPGYHATGRSAAFFAPGYGNRAVRRVTILSEAFFRSPPRDFTDVPLLRARDCLYVARSDQMERLRRLATELGDSAQRLDEAEVRRRVPIMRAGYARAGLVMDNGGDLDVDALLQGYLRSLRRRGGELVPRAPVTELRRVANAWQVGTPQGAFVASTVVNAAGAWADTIGEMAGAGRLGIQPMRRTACLVDAPDGMDPGAWPAVIDIDEQFYFKAEAGAILLSPADETACAPCDAYAEDIDVAVAVDRFEAATHVDVRRVTHRWAGLRSFAADRTPVVGFDPRQDGFFWLAGQGGYGVQTAPGLARLTAHLAAGETLAQGYGGLREVVRELAPDRLIGV